MDAETREFLERRFRIPEPVLDKTSTLAEAVAGNVRAGDALHLGTTHARGTAALWELLRQFHGTDPRFTFLSVSMTTPLAPLVHAGLATKIVTSWAGDAYWAPGPSPVYQRAWRSGAVEFEHWSILTFPQRLAAAARGLEWATTRSLIGSTMAEDNAADFRQIEPGLALLRALVPDVSFFHAPAADRLGNVLMSPPLMENVYGALAARRGAVVTVERIVDPSFVREHAHLTRLPASAVAAVVEAPFGAHPGGIFPRGIEGVEAYGEDYDFWVEIRKASKDPSEMDSWIKEWVLGPRTHAEYLEHLGAERLELLRERALQDRMPSDVASALEEVDLDASYSAIEATIVATARELKDRIRAGGYTTMLAGAGMANLAAWLAAYDLADEGVHVDLVAEMGLVGYWPRPGEPYIFNHRNFPTCTMVADIDVVLSILVGGGGSRSIGSLGAAQVDKHGNLNSTMVPGEYLLMGSGGANDVATCASESVATVTQKRERFKERVDYVTSPGDRIGTLVSTLGIYRKDQGEFVLTAVFGDDPAASAREARERCEWELRVARTLERIPPPTAVELRTLRLMDPRGWFRRES
jgi:acyl CoA:acetate/3-ketoacid CoA transferase alpha subunit/acyl CoA:acetate/3-ketoacid CoA transferase beta subunit